MLRPSVIEEFKVGRDIADGYQLQVDGEHKKVSVSDNHRKQNIEELILAAN